QVHAIPAEMIIEQVRVVAEDIGVDAVKIGMLGDEPTILAVAEALRPLAGVPVVVDPVMVSESGSVLLEPGARAALAEVIFPLATAVTPNLPEAREITGLGEDATSEELARAIRELGPGTAIVTGGHAEDGAD